MTRAERGDRHVPSAFSVLQQAREMEPAVVLRTSESVADRPPGVNHRVLGHRTL